MFKSIQVCGLILFVLMSLVYCSGGKRQSQTEAMEKEVLDIHNQVMPLLGEIARLKDELERSKEGLDSMAMDQLQGVDDLLLELTAANEGMMNWMRDYSGDFNEMGHEEVEQYLSDQMQEIEDVQDRISRAIEAAKKELGK